MSGFVRVVRRNNLSRWPLRACPGVVPSAQRLLERTPVLCASGSCALTAEACSEGSCSSRGLVTCVGAERDRYGRLLARCRARGVDVNAAMVRDGHAVAFGAHQAEEAEAKAAYRGLWAGTFERPQDWRRTHPRP